jgi:hypothetical protein
MENPTASDLVKKLARGEISRREFDLFLEALEDKSQEKSLEKGMEELFDKFLKESKSEEDENNSTQK